MHKKPDYKENARITMKEKSALPIDWDKESSKSKWPEDDRRSQIDRI
jgi:hypothetical protein